MAIPWSDSNDDCTATLNSYIFRICVDNIEPVSRKDYSLITKAKLCLSSVACTRHRQRAGGKKDKQKRMQKWLKITAYQKRLRKWLRITAYQKRLRKWLRITAYQKRLRKGLRITVYINHKKTEHTVDTKGQKSVSQDRNHGNSVSLSIGVGGVDECCQITRDGEGELDNKEEYISAMAGEKHVDSTDKGCSVNDTLGRSKKSRVMDGNQHSHDRDSYHSCDLSFMVGKKCAEDTDRDNITDGSDEDSHRVANDEEYLDSTDKGTPKMTDGGRGINDTEKQVIMSGFINITGSRDKSSNEIGNRANGDTDSNDLLAYVTIKKCGVKVTFARQQREGSESDDGVPMKVSNAKHGARIFKKAKSGHDNDVKDELEELFSAGDLERFLSSKVVVAMLKSPQTYPAQLETARTMVHTGLQQEMNRLATFYQFQAPAGTFVVPIAKSGFFLLAESGNSQQVECAFCGVRASITLFSGVNAMHVHRELSARCRFVLGENVGNVSIADVAKTSAAFFIEKYSLPIGLPGNTLAGPSSSVPSHAGLPLSQPGAPEIIVPDSVSTEAEMFALPSDALSNDSRGQTVTDSRPTSVPGQSSHYEDSSIQGLTSLGAGDTSNTSVLYQTATISPPIGGSQTTVSQTGGSQTAVSQTGGSQTAVRQTGGSQTAVRQTGGSQTAVSQSHVGGSVPYQTATVSQPGALSGDTTHESAAASTSLPRNDGQSTASGTGTTRSSAEGGAGENSQDRQLVTYEQLGIYSQRPKRPDMAVTQVRINTFENWPHRVTHPPVEMAEAGFYYTGHDDLVRCFHCKGGLKTWNTSDKPWIEHSRWFPQCPFIKVCKGPTFARAVSNLNNRSNPGNSISTICEQDVLREMKHLEEQEWKEVSQKNFRKVDMCPRSESENETPSASGKTEASKEETEEHLREENEELQSTTMCKMCQTNQVNVLFLPCGHLVSCSQCAPALRTCAMCRQAVKGLVRVHMDRKYDSDELRDTGWTSDDPNSADNS